jgi:hypothetical protein
VTEQRPLSQCVLDHCQPAILCSSGPKLPCETGAPPGGENLNSTAMHSGQLPLWLMGLSKSPNGPGHLVLPCSDSHQVAQGPMSFLTGPPQVGRSRNFSVQSPFSCSFDLTGEKLRQAMQMSSSHPTLHPISHIYYWMLLSLERPGYSDLAELRVATSSTP